uniref:Uncharacterized protein n=1 Tax=Sphaerodactylus townsendi TaxID=933632 RepID=A0ACB8EVY6_9SAUR
MQQSFIPTAILVLCRVPAPEQNHPSAGAYTSGQQRRDSASKHPSQLKSKSAAMPSEQGTRSQSRRFSTIKPTPHSPMPSRVSVGVETSKFDTRSMGIGPSVPFTVSEAAGPTQPPSQLSTRESIQRRSGQQSGVPAVPENVLRKDSITTARESSESAEIPIRLERSEKSRSLVQTAASQLTQQKVSQSRSNAPSSKERSATEARVTSQGSKLSEKQRASVPPSGVPSQGRTSAPYSQMAGMYNEAQGDMGSRPISREMSVKSKPSGKQQPSVPPSGVPSQGRTSAPYSQMAGMSEEPEGDMGSRPISREMSVKSKPSGKQQPSVPPSGVPSQGRTSAPYSQMAGMSEEAEGDMGSRPISREMSVKSKPSEKQQPSVPPSGVPSQGRSSIQTAPSQLTEQKVSQSQSNAPSFKEKSSTEAQVISQGSSRSARPLTPEERGELASQRSSRWQSQQVSRAASTRAPSGSAAARSRISEAVGSTDAYTRSVAVGPSGATSVAAGPSQAASQGSRVASAKSTASRPSPFLASQPASDAFRQPSAKSNATVDVCSKVWDGVNEEGDGAARTAPISREMSVKSKSSAKQQPSIPPSGVQSQGRTSAPYSQMAGMSEEAEEDMESRPISRAMSVKSKPSGKQQPSVPPSGVPSQGRTSAPYSQMAGMSEEPEGDMGSKPISRAMSVKSKPSGKQQPSVPPSGVPSQGRTSAPYSQMAGMSEEPEGDMGSRPKTFWETAALCSSFWGTKSGPDQCPIFTNGWHE